MKNNFAYIRLNWKNKEFTIFITKWLDVDSLLPDKEAGTPDKYRYLNYLCEFIKSRLPAAYILDIDFINDVLDIPDTQNSINFLINNILTGTLTTQNDKDLQLLNYHLNDCKLLDKIATFKFNHDIEINGHIINLCTAETLSSSGLKTAGFSAFHIYTVQNLEYVIYCSNLFLQQICNQFNLTHNESEVLDFSKIILDKIALLTGINFYIRKIHLSVLLPPQDYILLNVSGDCISGAFLLKNWTKSTRTEPINIKNKSMALTFPLIHGSTDLSISELSSLQKGDILLFDEEYAPAYVSINLGKTDYIFNYLDSRIEFYQAK